MKENYIKSKSKLKREIELMKNLSEEEISIYLVKIQALVKCYDEAQSSLRRVSENLLLD